MTNKDITKIYFRGNEIVALYRGDTLIFKKSSGGGSTTEPTGVYTVRGTLKPDSRAQNIQLCVNGQREQFDVNNDKTFEYTFVNVPVTNMEYFTLACKDELNTLDLSEFDTSQVKSMFKSFFQCSNLKSIDFTNVDTSNITDMQSMFYDCKKLTTLDVSKFNTSNVTNMGQMFFGCYRLSTLDVSKFNTSNVTNMNNMFSNCQELSSLNVSNFDTSKVTGMNQMFYSNMKLYNIDLSSFNTSNVTDMNQMFKYCERLKTLDLSSFNTSKVTDMNGMFHYCRELYNLDLSSFNTSNVTDIDYIFSECNRLKDLYINFNLKSISRLQYGVFYNCLSLTNVVGKFNNYKYNLGLSSCPLTAQSAMVFINGLATVTEKRTLALKASTYDSLTPEQIAIATSKGWTVTRG